MSVRRAAAPAAVLGAALLVAAALATLGAGRGAGAGIDGDATPPQAGVATDAGPDRPEPDRAGDDPVPVPGADDDAAPATGSEAADGARVPEPAGGSVVMWARGGLPAGLEARAAALPAVSAAALVRSDTLGLTGSRDADGAPVDQPPPGLRIPVAVAAVDPEAYAGTVTDERARPAVAALRPGEVLLSETAAGLRRVGVGAELDIGGARGLRVAGVVPDGTVRRTEIVAHADDAAALGLPEVGSLVVRHTAAPGTATSTLLDALEVLAPDDVPARVVPVGADGGRHTAPLVLSLLEIKERFGEFAYRPRDGVREIDQDPAFLAAHVVSAEVPILGTVRCHRLIVDDLRAALTEIVASGFGDRIDPSRYGGCHHPRRISADRDRLSSHAWGIAIDINVDLSLPGLGPVPPDEVVAAFARHGFRWGGDFLTPDNHHFEWVGDAARHRPER